MRQTSVVAACFVGLVACRIGGGGGESAQDPSVPPFEMTQPIAGRAAVDSNAGHAAAAAGSGGSAGMGKAGAGGSNPTADAGRKPTADAASSDQPAQDASTDTPQGAWSAGDYPPDDPLAFGLGPQFLQISDVDGQQGNVREYRVHIPPGYRSDTPTPVLFCIHGLGQDALLFCISGAEMEKKADAETFILVMPQGYNNSWNAGTCCGDASNERLNDVALFRAIFDEVAEHVNVDRKRVYATGLSNGGYMSYRLACEAADIFTAIAPGSGAVGTNEIGEAVQDTDLVEFNRSSDFTTCEPSRPVSVLAIHGTGDQIIPPSLYAPSLEHVALAYGCTNTTLPAVQPSSAGDTTCTTYTDCPAGIEVSGCLIENGGHCWFGSADCGTGAGELGMSFVGNNSTTMNNNDATWDFLKRMSR